MQQPGDGSAGARLARVFNRNEALATKKYQPNIHPITEVDANSKETVIIIPYIFFFI